LARPVRDQVHPRIAASRADAGGVAQTRQAGARLDAAMIEKDRFFDGWARLRCTVIAAGPAAACLSN
jgi:hypothetical protein